MGGIYTYLKRAVATVAVGAMLMASPQGGSQNMKNENYIAPAYSNKKVEYVVDRGYKDCFYMMGGNYISDSGLIKNVEVFGRDKDKDGVLDEIYVKAITEGKNGNSGVIYTLKKNGRKWGVVDIEFEDCDSQFDSNLVVDEYFYAMMEGAVRESVERYVNERAEAFEGMVAGFSRGAYISSTYTSPLHLKEVDESGRIWGRVEGNVVLNSDLE